MRRFKQSPASFTFDVFNTVFLIMFMVICAYPFYYMLCYAFSDPSAAQKGITFLPREFTFSNLLAVSRLSSIPKAALISLFRAFVGPLITLACCSFFGYLVTKRDMYFRKFIYRFVIITMYVHGGLIPTYLVYRAYGLRNTLWVYILPSAISAYYVILLKTFIEQLPPSLEEAATIDGAGVIACFTRIVLPLSKPILATIGLFAVVAQWNSWFDTHIYITRTEYFSLQYVLYNFLQEAQRTARALSEGLIEDPSGAQMTPATVRMTITAITTLPIMMVYPFMQRYFVKGIMIGAIKG